MNTALHFGLEVLVVGVIIAIIGLVCSVLLMYAFVDDFSLSEYHFWRQVMLSYFLTGCLAHVLFQITGVNAWYITHGVSAKSKKFCLCTKVLPD